MKRLLTVVLSLAITGGVALAQGPVSWPVGGPGTPKWTTPAFDNTNFTAAGAMTWTVEAADIDALAYTIAGKVMTVSFTIKATSIGGTPDTEVYILIPASKTSTKLLYNVCSILDNGAWALGRVYVAAGGTTIRITRMDNAVFTASTNTTRVFGQITFQIN